MASQGLRDLQRQLDSGRFASKSELLDFINNEAYEGRLPYSSDDLYTFFRKPKEARQISSSEKRARDLQGQAVSATGQEMAHQARRLGVGGMLQNMVSNVKSQRDASNLSQAINESIMGAYRDIQSQDRMGDIEQVARAYERGTAKRASDIATGGSATGSLTGAGIGAGVTAAAAANPAGFITGPIAAGISALATAIGGAVGTGAGQLAAADEAEKGAKEIRKFRNRPLKLAQFAPSGARFQGSRLSPTGSNETALMSAYGTPTNETESDFLFPSNNMVS